ncbi:MAG: tol-pal system YbgF family protein, partial [Chitinophagales bacterium]
MKEQFLQTQFQKPIQVSPYEQDRSARVYFVLRSDLLHESLRLSGQKDPEINEKSQFGLGWCELKLGYPRQAINYFQEVFDKSSGAQARTNALVQMADVYQENKQWDD